MSEQSEISVDTPSVYQTLIDAKQYVYQEQSPEIHLLKRLTWGVRSEDIAALQQIGIEGYINWQLHYEQIPDPVVEDFMAKSRFLKMSTAELFKETIDNPEKVVEEFLYARIFRAVYSERQLYEIMVEFWSDHFNVPYGAGFRTKIIHDREAIRKYALSSFREILFENMMSPAVLIYLTNDNSHKDAPNENLARELMELYTLGVNGGYSEQDVKEVAKAFTGWKISWSLPNLFYFDHRFHDTDEKTVLGHVLSAGRGIEDGMDVLDILATHPSTARFICSKLVCRFVSDIPPETLVNSASQVFTETNGNIREVLKHILLSPEFSNSKGQKFRRPMEFFVAVIRGLLPGIEIINPQFVYQLGAMGHLPYWWPTPDGYPDVATPWMNTNSLLERWNFPLLLLSLENFRIFNPNVILKLDWMPSMATVGEVVDYVVNRFLHVNIIETDRAELITFMCGVNNPAYPMTSNLRTYQLPTLIALVLASPYFQWR